MRKLLQPLFFFLLVTQICFAQQGWISRSKPTYSQLYGVCFTDENTGWAVGRHYWQFMTGDIYILRTADGGLSWTQQYVGTTWGLSDISFINDLKGIIVGGHGTILKTIDGGASWTEQTSGTTNDLLDISISDENNGTAVGSDGTIIRTTNGGTTWTQQTIGTTLYLYGVSFTDENNGMVVGEGGTILNTSNGGITWISQNSGTTQTLFGVYFFNTTDAIAVGDSGKILRTTDAGTTWISQTNVTTDKLEDVTILDSLHCWAAGGNGTVLRTVDGGISWSKLITGTHLPLRSIFFTDSNHGIVVGGISGRFTPTAGMILRTTDSGITWESQSGTNNTLIDVSFFDSNIGLAIGDNGPTLRTTNGGKNWTIQDYSFQGYFLGTDAYCVNSTTAYLVSFAGIRKTTDAGITWSDLTIDSISIQGISFSNENTGTMVGYSSPGGVCGTAVILRTTDSGNSWNYQTSPTDLPLTDVCFVDADHGWIVGSTAPCGQYPGVILNTTDGGATWVEQWSSPSVALLDVCFVDVNNGWAVGGKNWYQFSTILHTTNGGVSWTQIIDSTKKEINGVYFTDVNNGWIVGGGYDSLWNSFSTILHTDNGGTTWTQQESGVTNILSSVHYLDANVGWIVGADGAILHTTNGGVSFIEEDMIDEVPSEFLLSQNYPNPFNPSTRIKYSVLQSSQVQIKIFDVLGNEIETLVNEEKPTGTYKLTWNAVNLPSGVYFYQLKAGEFINTKKMILIK